MILRTDYATAKAALATAFRTDRGCPYFAAEQLLFNEGFAVQRIWQHDASAGSERAPWPPEPWADLHWCEVEVSPTAPGSHMVVMLADGTVLDPLTPNLKRLSDYHRVIHVAGVYRVWRRCDSPANADARPL